MFNRFNKSHQEAIQDLQRYINPSEYEPDMSGMVRWMLETDANPYAYLGNYAGAFASAQAFLGLCHSIHHALYDDGDITFVTVNGEPRIVFNNRHEPTFRDTVLNNMEKSIEDGKYSILKTKYDIKPLDITPDEFCRLYDEWQARDIKRCFLWDALPRLRKTSLEEIEHNAKHYRVYKCWDESWLEEAKELYFKTEKQSKE